MQKERDKDKDITITDMDMTITKWYWQSTTCTHTILYHTMAPQTPNGMNYLWIPQLVHENVNDILLWKISYHFQYVIY